MSVAAEAHSASRPRLILFVTGDAPRSLRARANLAETLKRLDIDPTALVEIDLTADPTQTLSYGIFATPALLRASESGRSEVLYGDLSERKTLERFLTLS
jgi:circadian clock protein KaiB